MKASVDEWKKLARGDRRLEEALVRLHLLFRDADTLGSLIDPRRVTEIAGNGSPQQSLDDVNWDAVAPLLATAAVSEPTTDPAMAVLGADAAGLAVAANLLSRGYTLVATNVPYLSRTKQAPALAEFCSRAFPKGTPDLAVAFLLRLATFVVPGGTYAALFPEQTLNLNAYRRYREWTLTEQVWDCCAVLGARGFSTPMFDFGVVMAILSNARPSGGATTAALDVSRESGTDHKAAKLRNGAITTIAQSAHSANPDSRFLLSQQDVGALLSQYAESTQGICTGDYPRSTFGVQPTAVVRRVAVGVI